jgi:pimeloyl-ACP methyl ester carboxylesterase
MKKSSKILLGVALILCLLSGIFASSFMTDFGKVDVEDLRVVVDDGKYINAQVYIPKLASPDNKLPLVVVQHGSYNNFDHQDQNMIELARRGFVVISPDAYNHGNSYVIDGGTQFTNCIHLIDYAYASFNFIDLDKIGISGYSMGAGIASETVRHYFEQEATGAGPNKVSAIVDVGYDPQYTPYEFEGVAEPVDLTIDWGVIAAKYDEWFFKDANGDPRGYLQNPNAVAFVNQLDGVDVTEVENHKIYKGTIDGEEYIRVINQNVEIHPLNHFSKNSAADMINFFYEAFGVPSGYEKIDAYDQIWMWKEIFNCVGLVGIFLFLFPFADMMISGTKFFAELRQPEPAPAPALSDGKKKGAYWLTYLINTALPALLVVPIAFKLIGKESFVPSTVTQWFGEPNTNELATWTIVVGVVLLAVFLISHALTKPRDEKGAPACWGVDVNLRVLWKSFLLALLTVSVAYVILFFTDLVFNVDFRIWVIDMRVFDRMKIIFAIAYFPAWAVFYLVNSLLVNGGNRVEGRPEWLTLLISCIGNIAGIVVLIVIQYTGLINHGTFAFNSMRIVNLFPLVILIPLGTIVSRKFFKETGKIYVGSFIIAMLYCMMTVANTMVNATILY